MSATIENNFMYHKPNPDQTNRYEDLRERAKGLAYMIERYCPPSVEKDRAMMKLEECVMWANASIARNG